MRRIYIIPKSMDIKDAELEAKANSCPEIVKGIPPNLKNVISEDKLPCVYEEPQIPNEPDPLLQKIEELEKRIEELEK